MKASIDKNGAITVTITKTVELRTNKQREFIKTLVTQDKTYRGEDAHARWTALYNAYDLYYDVDIRAEHEEYNKQLGWEISRLSFMDNTKRMGRLLYVASKLYRNEFEAYIEEYME